VAKRNKLKERSPLLPLAPLFFRGSATLEEAMDSIEGDLFRRMQECDEDEAYWATDLRALLLLVQRAIKRGDAKSAAQWAFEFGMVSQFFDYTFNYGASQDRGEKFDAALQRAAEGRANHYQPRNIEMARVFQKKLPSWGRSRTALMVDIGKAQGLERSASIEAVESGLKVVRSRAKPDK
jgi:hypothetical protein